MRERFRNYKTGRKMVIAFFSIILLYVVTVTVAIVNVETISSRMEAIYADQFANVQSSLRMTASRQLGEISLFWLPRRGWWTRMNTCRIPGS